jgi:toxin CptA
MPNSPNSSAASAPCLPPEDTRPGSASRRLEWRPSRWLTAALVLLGTLAAVSVLASAMPATIAWLVAATAAGRGLWLARRESGKPRLHLRLLDSGTVEIDGEPVDDFRVTWRGPLAFMSWRDRAGRGRRRTWWPDTLPPAACRELRLAAPVEPAARASSSMAP